MAELVTSGLGKKENPIQPEATIRGTLNKMRKKGLIEFLDMKGRYRLTAEGYAKAKEIGATLRYDDLMAVVKAPPAC